MKGVIFNIFEEFVIKNLGLEAWDKVIQESQTESQVFIGPKTYEDAIFFKLLTTCLTLNKLPPAESIRAFGKFAFPLLTQRVPNLTTNYKTPEELLEKLDGIVHVEVKKLLENAQTPKFNFHKLNENEIDLEYISKKKLCLLVEGLIEGLAEQYKCDVKYDHYSCTQKGHPSCKFRISFIKKDS